MADQNNIPTGRQIRAARALLGITQNECAQNAGVALSSLKKYEGIDDDDVVLMNLKYLTVTAIVNFLLGANIRFEGSGSSESVILLK